MSTQQIRDYFQATAFRETRDDLKVGVQLVKGPRIAIDCGCGAGSDIAFLRANGFTVHAFDIEQDAIDRCRRRFAGDVDVILSRESFSTFDYPSASLVVADASLFFCPQEEFETVWGKIKRALYPGGIFVGSFLGPEDTMAGPNYDRHSFWSDVLVASEEMVRAWLQDFDILLFVEHRKSGPAVDGSHHQWHIFSVVAKQRSNTKVLGDQNAMK